jgi:tRNA U34 5-carboxymethylaminomethyl modifying GTPase MnmE/TrmE
MHTGAKLSLHFSGYGKCGVAVIRISGPSAKETIINIAKLTSLPRPRQALLRSLKDPVTNDTLDRGLVLWFPGMPVTWTFHKFWYYYYVSASCCSN